MQAILNVAEERLGEVLREESKVVRRQLSGGGGLIHLCELANRILRIWEVLADRYRCVSY